MGIDERRELIETFLRRCVTYADASIERKIKRGDDGEIIAKWQAYRDFTEHAAEEVASGDLDTWLEDNQTSESGSCLHIAIPKLCLSVSTLILAPGIISNVSLSFREKTG